jgi:peptidoglycan/LPS O-acetylase OafA/YrhL
VALLSYAALFCLKEAAGRDTLRLTYDYGVLRALPTFAIGMVMSRWHQSPPDLIKKWLSLDIVTGFALAGVIASMHVGASDVLIIGLMCVLVMSASLNTSHVSRSLSVSPLYTLGVLSYSIYMTHGLLQRAWQLVFQKVLYERADTPIAVGLLMTMVALVVGVSWFTYKYVESPGRRALNRCASWLRSGARPLPQTAA